MGDAIALSISTVVLSGRPVPVDLTFKRYDAIRPFIAEAGRYLIDLRKSSAALRDQTQTMLTNSSAVRRTRTQSRPRSEALDT